MKRDETEIDSLLAGLNYLIEDGHRVDGRRRVLDHTIDRLQIVQRNGFADADHGLVQGNVQPSIDGRFEPSVK